MGGMLRLSVLDGQPTVEDSGLSYPEPGACSRAIA